MLMYFGALLCIYGDLLLLFICTTFKCFAYVAEKCSQRKGNYLTAFNQFKSLTKPLIRKERTEELVKSKTRREFEIKSQAI